MDVLTPQTASRPVPARRSELEIRMDMLRVIKEGADKPTQVMYKANLSWIALQAHLKLLLSGGLLREVELGSRKTYELTEKGQKILLDYERLVEQMLGPLTPVFNHF
ncbi:MAG TPA: winged helix-turn-helix domain-containing protein [Nitrososphaerales archaeon]|nr:winged helix-turn-helix domain-containing protein [Nitrososphaerales archaeon]